MLHIRQSFPPKHIYFYHDEVKKKVRVPAKEKFSHQGGRVPAMRFLKPQLWSQPSRHQPLIDYHKAFFLATEGPNHGNQWVGLRSRVCRLSIGELGWANMSQQVKNLPAMQEIQVIQVLSLDRKDLVEEKMATHSSILAWQIPWTEKPGELQTMGWYRVKHNWTTKLMHNQNKTCKHQIWKRELLKLL